MLILRYERRLIANNLVKRGSASRLSGLRFVAMPAGPEARRTAEAGKMSSQSASNPILITYLADFSIHEVDLKHIF